MLVCTHRTHVVIVSLSRLHTSCRRSHGASKADARLIVRNAVPPQRLLSLLQTDRFDRHVALNRSHTLVALTDLGPDDLDVVTSLSSRPRSEELCKQYCGTKSRLIGHPGTSYRAAGRHVPACSTSKLFCDLRSKTFLAWIADSCMIPRVHC